LRDDFTPASDIDILVEFEPGVHVGFMGFQGLEDELTALFGRKVDLNTPQCLSDSFRDRVLREARAIHVAA
jgi:predicted nucleotidyltransferase